MPRRILILGGARYLGFRTARELVRRGHAVSVLNRGRFRNSYPEGIRVLLADRLESEAVARVLARESFDVVLDNNAYSGPAVTAIADAVRGRVPRYVLTSTVAVYGKWYSDHPLKEEAPAEVAAYEDCLPPNIVGYAKGKREAEIALSRFSDAFRFTVARFPNIYGEGDFSGKLGVFDRMIQAGGPLVLEKEVLRISCIHIDDAARALATLLEYEPENLVHNVASPEPESLESFFAALYGMENFSRVTVERRPARRLWEQGFHLSSPWSPPMDSSSFLIRHPDFHFRDVTEWAPLALSYSRERQDAPRP